MRHKTKEEKESDDKDYIQWLKGEGGRITQQHATDMVRSGSHNMYLEMCAHVCCVFVCMCMRESSL